jgi:phosphoribosylglycinamide formyltransferase 2
MTREGIRRLAAEELQLPTSPYAFSSSYAELEAAANSGIGFPCFIKPVMSSSGKGQSRVDRLEDLEAAWKYAASAGRVQGTRVIIEGMVEFDYEITLLTVRALGDDGKIETQFCDPIGHVQVKGDYVESWQPQPMSDKVLARAKEIAEAVTGALGGRGLFGVELFVKGQEVWFSEVSPRPHDTGMVTMATQAQNEFELHVRAMLGLPVGTRMRRPGASAVIYGGVEAEGIRFENVDAALRVPESQLRLFGKPVAYERRRMGVALATADRVETARKRAKECAAKVRPVA